ncbi:MAG: DUF1259 domain-containing protein [Gemmatimonadetes bacterium]|nr:DUF1259 domain-containing protein [Gemmatimonadota bacterium]
MRRIALLAVLLAVGLRVGAQSARISAWDSVGRILHVDGEVRGDYVRHALPRRDVAVSVAGVRLATALSGDGWVGLHGTPDRATLLGDVVVLPSELSAFERALLAGGLAFTSVHSRLVGETPHLVYVHVLGRGAATTLAAGLDRALASTGIVRPPIPEPSRRVTADTATVFRVLGERGAANGDVVSIVTELLPGHVIVRGDTLSAALASSSVFNLQFLSAGRVLVVGDVMAGERQLEPVIRALVQGGLTVTAVHLQLAEDIPRVVSTHFFGDGPPDAMLAALRAAMDAARTGARRPSLSPQGRRPR